MKEKNRYSKEITQQKSRGAAQAMLHATGISEEDLAKPQVGVCSNWYKGNPCNMHLNELASLVDQSLQKSKLLSMRFNTIGVSDGISMGTSGMNYSLQSRDLIADSIETVMQAQWYDGLICIPGCDKNMPGAMIAMMRLNRPSLIIYGGTIAPGCSRSGDRLDVVSAFQSYGSYLNGSISEEERSEIVKKSCPGPGACGGMYTANTMACAIEALGLSLPGSSSFPAVSEQKLAECQNIGKTMDKMLEMDLKPSDIITKKSFENAIALTMALGGSTNAVLHLLAVANSCNISLSLDDFQRISDSTPYLADLKPSGKYVMQDLFQVGGTPSVLKLLLKEGFIDGNCLTVTGKTLAENIESWPDLEASQKVILPISKPLSTKGHLKILKGNLAPEGAVAKITGKEGELFSGEAIAFDSEEDMLTALEKGKIKKGHVIVIRYEGPKGGPGMPEMLTPTSAIMGAGLGSDVAMITDGRFSGGSHGFIVGHVCPEAQEGGPIALIHNGDKITIDAKDLTIKLEVEEKELLIRKSKWIAPELKIKRGSLGKYVRLVSSASLGCVTDSLD